MKVDFNVPLKTLAGVADDKAPMLAELVANLLSTETKGNSLKLYGWAVRLTKKEVLDLDKSDFDTLKRLIEESERMVVLVKGQLLEVLRDAENAEKELAAV